MNHSKNCHQLTSPYPGKPFIERFQRLAAQRSPFCLGVDPSKKVLETWGMTADCDGLADFCERLTDLLGAKLAMVKPQTAYFECYGPKGLAVLKKFSVEMQHRGVLVLLDAKRGDITETNSAYARAFFDKQFGYGVDGLTASPFLGFDALIPMLELASDTNGYVFVVVSSSNQEGQSIQQAITRQGISVSEHLAQAINDYNSTIAKVCGAVIGATRSSVAQNLTKRLDNALILVPGLGAQGGDYSSLTTFANQRAVIPTASRSVLLASGDSTQFNSALNYQIELARRLYD